MRPETEETLHSSTSWIESSGKRIARTDHDGGGHGQGLQHH
jgi:hypothetical protein